jgi:hypothetical protein
MSEPTADKQLLPFIQPGRGNYLRPNGLGGYIVRQSDLSSWSRCQMQKLYDDRARHDPGAPQPRALSATEFGSVAHYATMRMEIAMHEGRDDALQIGLQTFEYYWQPEHIEELPGVRRINEWLPRDTFGGLRERGRRMLKDHYDLLRKDESWLLGLEYQFAVPIVIGEITHTLTGTIDRLAIRKLATKPYIALDDNKTGKQPTYLRWNMQGTAYAYATTRPEFWLGWPGSGMFELEAFPEETINRLDGLLNSYGYRLHEGSEGDLPLASRRFRWINLKEIKFVDGGWRNARDYARLHLAVDSYVRAVEAEVYAINTTGEICRYCPFRTTCGGVGLPDEEAGAP